MTPKEITLICRFCISQGTSWDKLISDFCEQNLTAAKAWARTQKVETIDGLLANTEPPV